MARVKYSHLRNFPDRAHSVFQGRALLGVVKQRTSLPRKTKSARSMRVALPTFDDDGEDLDQEVPLSSVEEEDKDDDGEEEEQQQQQQQYEPKRPSTTMEPSVRQPATRRRADAIAAPQDESQGQQQQTEVGVKDMFYVTFRVTGNATKYYVVDNSTAPAKAKRFEIQKGYMADALVLINEWNAKRTADPRVPSFRTYLAAARKNSLQAETLELPATRGREKDKFAASRHSTTKAAKKAAGTLRR